MRVQPFAFIGGGAESFLARGGTVSGSFTSASVEYQYHIFSSSGNFEVLRGTNNSVEILLVGGGGAGQNNATNATIGGGGGGVLYTSSITLTPNTFPIIVGNGGLTTETQDGQASGSSFAGGGVFFAVSGGYQGGQAYSGEPQYNVYGTPFSSGNGSAAGGGGGAGSVGGAGSEVSNVMRGGVGGTGSFVRILNTGSYYGGGGGGGAISALSEVAGTGGLGGGATAGSGVAGAANTGGGGGGRHNGGTNESAGGSGVVIVQYRTLGLPPFTFTLASGSTELQACGRYGSGSTATYYAYNTLIQSGSVVYGPNDYNTLFSGYLSNGTQVYNVVSGAVQTAPAGCPVIYSLTLSSGSTPYAPAACLRFSSGSTATYYSYNIPSPQSGSLLYLDSNLTITASNGYVASGSGYWQLINGAPISTSATACETIYSLTLSGNVTASATGACYDSTTATYYALSSSILSGSLLFTTSSMMSVVGDGFLSNGTGYWQFISGASTTTLATTCPTLPVTLPSGAVLVYDFSDIASWPGSGRFVYDLSGNGFTGSLYDVVGSGSADGISFDSSTAVLECTSSAFNSALTNRKQLYVNVQYQTGSFGKYTSLASTWDALGTKPNIGYDYFLSVNATGAPDTGIQVYNSGGGGATGYYDTGVNYTIPTGSVDNTYSIMANITSGSYDVAVNNSIIRTKTGINTAKFFVYDGTSATGNGMRFGNRLSGENFLGLIKKIVVYNRALSQSERDTIENWMTS